MQKMTGEAGLKEILRNLRKKAACISKDRML